MYYNKLTCFCKYSRVTKKRVRFLSMFGGFKQSRVIICQFFLHTRVTRTVWNKMVVILLAIYIITLLSRGQNVAFFRTFCLFLVRGKKKVFNRVKVIRRHFGFRITKNNEKKKTRQGEPRGYHQAVLFIVSRSSDRMLRTVASNCRLQRACRKTGKISKLLIF